MIVFGLVSLTSSIALSRLLDRSDPDLAVAFYPLNSDGIARKAARQLVGDIDRAALLNLQSEIQGALHYDRIDARLFSLLGEIAGRLGSEEDARSYFDHAFRLSKTELLTLNHMVVRAVREGQPVEAAGYLDILLRRWPERLNQVMPVVPALLADPSGYAEVLGRLGNDPPWRARIINTLNLEPETVPLAGRLILDLSGTDNPARPTELAATIGGHIRHQLYENAYRLFLFTLTDDERKRGGYIFNGDFQHASTRRPFDWQLQDQSGLEVVMPGDRGGREVGTVARFLDKPVKNISLWQYLYLPPGDYRLSLDASASGLSLPKDLFWSLKCHNQNLELGRMLIPEGTYRRTRVERDFRVEAETCPLQVLRLETGLIAESWRYRYSGTLTMHRINIERVLP